MSKNINLSEATLKKLKKSYINTGDSSIALGVLNIFAAPFLYYSWYHITNLAILIPSIIVQYAFLFPFVYYGYRIKKDKLENLNKSLEINRNMLIYSISYLILSLVLGGGVGIVFFILIYYFWNSYNQTKKAISDQKA